MKVTKTNTYKTPKIHEAGKTKNFLKGGGGFLPFDALGTFFGGGGPGED